MVSQSLILDVLGFLSVLKSPQPNDNFEPRAASKCSHRHPTGIPSRQPPMLENHENDEVLNFFGIPGALRYSGSQALRTSGSQVLRFLASP